MFDSSLSNDSSKSLKRELKMSPKVKNSIQNPFKQFDIFKPQQNVQVKNSQMLINIIQKGLSNKTRH